MPERADPRRIASLRPRGSRRRVAPAHAVPYGDAMPGTPHHARARAALHDTGRCHSVRVLLAGESGSRA